MPSTLEVCDNCYEIARDEWIKECGVSDGEIEVFSVPPWHKICDVCGAPSRFVISGNHQLKIKKALTEKGKS